MLGFRLVVEGPAYGSCQIPLGAEQSLRIRKEKTSFEEEYNIFLNFCRRVQTHHDEKRIELQRRNSSIPDAANLRGHLFLEGTRAVVGAQEEKLHVEESRIGPWSWGDTSRCGIPRLRQDLRNDFFF